MLCSDTSVISHPPSYVASSDTAIPRSKFMVGVYARQQGGPKQVPQQQYSRHARCKL